jgi:hypothetical protein
MRHDSRDIFARIHELGRLVRMTDCAFGHELSAQVQNGTLVPDKKSITTKVTKVHEAIGFPL